MFRPPTKYSEYLQDVRKSIDYILKRVNATTVTQIVAGTNVTISPASGTGAVTINASSSGGSLPAGGTTGQILAKINNVDYNAEWIDNYAQWTSTLKQEVKASESINKGQAVYVSTADGTNMIVSKSSNTTEATSSKTLGLLAQNLAINGKGFVITEGLLSGLDTSTANIGDPVWLGANGNLIFGLVNKPYAPLHLVSIGIVTRVNSNNGEIFVKVQNGFELDELHNVDARNPNNNDGIFYNSSTLLWEHKPVSSVYATPTLAQVTTAGNTTTNAITVGGLTVATNLIYTDTVNGRVGINTPSPTRTLDVNATQAIIRASSTTTTNSAGIVVTNSILSRDFWFGRDSSVGNGFGMSSPAYAGVINARGPYPLYIGANDLNILSLLPNGNVLIGTTTDAGYKLDVNGTARVNGRITAGNASTAGEIYSNPSVGMTFGSGQTTNTFTFIQINSGRFQPAGSVEQAHLLMIVGQAESSNQENRGSVIRHTGTVSTSSGNAIFSNFQTNNVINTTGGTTIYRGFYHNPTLTSLTGTTHRAIETVTGDVIFGSTSGNVAVGTTTAVAKFTVAGSITAASALAQGVFFNNTLVAAANNDVLVGLDINPTFTNGAFTGVNNYLLNMSSPSVSGAQVYINKYQYGNTWILNFKDGGTTQTGFIFEGYGLQLGSSGGLGGLLVGKWGVGYNVGTSTVPVTLSVNGSVGIGITTDAGYKLDVNGTTRSQTGFVVGSGSLTISGSTITSNTLLQIGGTGGTLFQQNNLYLASNTNFILGYWVPDNTTKSGITIGGDFTIGGAGATSVGNSFRFTTALNTYNGNVTLNHLSVTNTINTTAGTTLQRGFYYNPTLTGTVGFTHRAIETTSGDVIFNGGNVGIGTSTPSYPFHISSAAAANIYGTVQSTNANGTAAWVAFNDQSDNVVYRVFGSGASGTQMGIPLARTASLMANLGGTGKFLLGTFSNTDFILGTGNAEKMRIVDSTGNILIATTTDLGNKLQVNGAIDATGYKVNNTAGYTGTLVIVTNPPGQQNIDIRGGIVVNIF